MKEKELMDYTEMEAIREKVRRSFVNCRFANHDDVTLSDGQVERRGIELEPLGYEFVQDVPNLDAAVARGRFWIQHQGGNYQVSSEQEAGWVISTYRIHRQSERTDVFKWLTLMHSKAEQLVLREADTCNWLREDQ